MAVVRWLKTRKLAVDRPTPVSDRPQRPVETDQRQRDHAVRPREGRHHQLALSMRSNPQPLGLTRIGGDRGEPVASRSARRVR